jgi:hypothetical protein
MAWTKSPKSLVDLFELSLPEAPGLQRRKMFGYPVAFVNGNMCAGLFQLSAELVADHGARPFEPMPGRPMRAYLTLPEEVVEDEARLADLLGAACAFTAGLPPKASKSTRGSPR